jgi:hypothetical protein
MNEFFIITEIKPVTMQNTHLHIVPPMPVLISACCVKKYIDNLLKLRSMKKKSIHTIDFNYINLSSPYIL